MFRDCTSQNSHLKPSGCNHFILHVFNDSTLFTLFISVITASFTVYSHMLVALSATVCLPLPGSVTVSVLTRRLKPAGCGCCVGNSRWGCFPTSCLPRCSYRSNRAWRTTRRPLGSCGKPPLSLQHRRGVRHCLNCLGPHWKHPMAIKAGGFICKEEKNQIPLSEFLIKINIAPI